MSVDYDPTQNIDLDGTGTGGGELTSSSDTGLGTLDKHDGEGGGGGVYDGEPSPDEEQKNENCCSNFSLIPHGGIVGSGFNLASATLGAGTLALPRAMENSGVLVGSLVLVVVCASTIFSVTLLVRLFEKTGYATYEEMAKNFVGPKFSKFTAFLIVAFCWGITIVYVTAMGDILEQVAEAKWFPKYFNDPAGNELLIMTFWLCCFLPLSLLKEINSLRYSSVIGIFATMFLVTALCVHFATSGHGAERLNTASFDVPMIASLPVFIFAYCCQTNSFEIYTELKPRTVKRMTKSCALSMSICTVIYIIAGIAGSGNFGTRTHGNILKNYSVTESIYITFAYISITFTLVAAFPLCIFPTRDALLQLMGYASAYKTPVRVRIILCASLAYLSLVCGIYAPGIQVLFGLLGGICGSSLGFIFPAIFTLKSKDYSLKTAGILEYAGVWFLLIFGSIAGLLGTVLSIVDTIQNPPAS